MMSCMERSWPPPPSSSSSLQNALHAPLKVNGRKKERKKAKSWAELSWVERSWRFDQIHGTLERRRYATAPEWQHILPPASGSDRWLAPAVGAETFFFLFFLPPFPFLFWCIDDDIRIYPARVRYRINISSSVLRLRLLLPLSFLYSATAAAAASDAISSAFP